MSNSNGQGDLLQRVAFVDVAATIEEQEWGVVERPADETSAVAQGGGPRETRQVSVGQNRFVLDEIGDSTHYHATYVAPRWRRGLNRTEQIGSHIFYRMPGVTINGG
jgi:spore germination cell wall hydrolase CwlJ-like protein